MFVLYQGERERGSLLATLDPRLKLPVWGLGSQSLFIPKPSSGENHFARIGTISIYPDFWGKF